jgi:predicted RNA-binding Zn ribbon-like protein
MKNRELLAVGPKAAPGDLIFVQGFVNMPFVLPDKGEMDKLKAFKTWMVRHGFLAPAVSIDESDLKTALSFRNGLRCLLRANNGIGLDEDNVKLLNRLAGKCNLTVFFQPDGTAILQPTAKGLEKALGSLLVVVINAMADGSWWRLKSCRESKCQWVFYDTSKNRSGRWCAMTVCGSRTKARAYRKRQAEKSR